MKSKRYEGGDLKRVLAGMVVDQTICTRIASQWQPEGLFDTPWANMIARWCIKHLEKYGKPPNGQLKDIYQDWASRTNPDEEILTAVERFLRTVSNEYADSDYSSDYLLDVASRLLNKVRLTRAMEEATIEIERGKVDDAYNRLVGINRVELGTGALVKPAEEFEPWRQAFDLEKQKPLIEYPGDLGRLVGNAFARDSLIAFMAPDKTGKSFYLLDVAFRGVKARRRVAYIEAGDLCQDEVIKRLGQRASRMPLVAGKYEYPVGFKEEYDVQMEKRTYEAVTAASAYKAYKKVVRGKDLFRLSCHANTSIDVAGITSLVRDWEREGWIPDIIVIDYADILAPPAGVRDTLDQIDTTWKQLRRLSQELHCLVVTATQANSASYTNENRLLSRRHFSGRKTKLAHVNGMLALNVTSKDKEQGVTRVNWVVRRSGAYSETCCVHVSGCLAIGCPVIKSTF